MSQLPNLHAPDGFELAVFARSMLSQLPSANAPDSFEASVLKKSTGKTVPQTVRPARRFGIGWKTTLASVALLATLGSVTWFTGTWKTMGLSGGDQVGQTNQLGQTEQSGTRQTDLPSEPANPAILNVPDIKKVSPHTRKQVIKRGKSAVNNAAKAVAGYPPGQ